MKKGFDFNRYHEEKVSQIPVERRDYAVVPAVVCKDGFSLSIQASKTHYCSPRDSSGPYWQVEVGYPAKNGEPYRLVSLMEWAEDKHCKGVFGYVPVEKVEAIVNKHGGKVGETYWIPNEDNITFTNGVTESVVWSDAMNTWTVREE